MNELNTQMTPKLDKERGLIGWILLFLLGIPVPILIILFAVRGCT